jgi:hypothetical protein
LAAARRWRTQSPGTQSVLAVQRGIAEELGSKPSLVKLKEALRQAGTEFDEWVDGLRDAPQHRSGREIFSSWLAADPSARSSISAELVTALEGVSSDPELVSVARALGAVDGQVDWSAIAVEHLPADWVQRLVVAAREQSQIGWLLDGLAFGSSSLNKAALTELKMVDSEYRERALVERLAAWPETPVRAGTLGKALERVIRHLGEGTSPSIATAALDIAARSPKEEWAPSYVTVATGLSSIVELQDALTPVDEGSLVELLSELAQMPASEDSPRCRLLAAAAQRSPALVAKPNVWRGMPLPSMNWVIEHGGDPQVLVEQLGESVIRPAVRRDTSSMRPAELFGLAAQAQHLSRFIEPATVLKAADRSDPAARLLKDVLLQHEAGLTVSATSLRASLDTLSQQLLEASAQHDGLKAELSRKEDELRRLRAHVQEVRESQRSLLDAELRQGRLDVLRTLIDATERVRELAAVELSGEALLRGLHGDMIRHLDGFGISVVGEVGVRRPFDSQLDTVLGAAAEMVEVVTPSYVARAGADITVLRRSSVRGLDEREGN